MIIRAAFDAACIYTQISVYKDAPIYGLHFVPPVHIPYLLSIPTYFCTCLYRIYYGPP
jgi:hypothetical protein